MDFIERYAEAFWVFKGPQSSKVQFLEWPLEAGFKSNSSSTEPHIHISNSSAEINIFTVWYQKIKKKEMCDNCMEGEFLCTYLIN